MMLKGVILFSLTAAVIGLGINCRGSGACTSKDALGTLNNLIQGIQGSRQYNNGEHIACVGRGKGIIGLINPNDGYCLFLQGTANGINGDRIKQLIALLMEHGCKGCGSIPINYPDNNPDNGILTSNYVSNKDNPCDGLC
uniref:Killer toxin Kp4 domain-containing protein n=1 Tax=Panagrolaimus davidi TaxID=227884 RepID=A0A914QBT0_9BILA